MRSSVSSRLGFQLTIAAIFTLMLGCTRANDIEVTLPDGAKLKMSPSETLRINISTEPPSLDWHKSTDTTSSQITDNIMEGLVEYDLNSKDLRPMPALAVKWEPNDKATKWKFTLREGITWTDGVPFTSEHVVDGFRRLLDRATASEYAYFLYGVKNARAFNEGKIAWDGVGVKAEGPHTVTIELEKPMSYFPYLLTHHSTFPVRMDVVNKHGDLWTDPGKVVTLGAYKLVSWQHDRLIAMERNENYYGEKPPIKYIAAYMIQEQATAINLFDSGRLDFVHKLPSVELRKLRGRPEFRSTPVLTIYFYGINTTKPPMDKAIVRRAIAMSIDRNELVQMLAGGQTPLTGFVPAGMFGYDPSRGLKFDPKRGKALLKEAGYSDISKFPIMEIRFNTNEDHQRIAENIQAQLKRNLGINVELKNEEWKVYLNTQKTDPPHLYRTGWQADYPDPDNFLTLMTSYSENNRTRWKSKAYDQLVEKAAGVLDRDERIRLYSEAQKLMIEQDVPVIPLFTSVSHSLVSPRLQSFPINVMDRLIYKGARFK